MLKLDNVSKVYRVGTFGGGELQAVSSASFEIGEREVVSLIGESGSGKSTIGKMVLCLIKPSSGVITFNGVDVSTLRGSDLKDYYRTVQGVFQDPFSSYNPIFKVGRVFGMIRDEFFAELPASEWQSKLERSIEAVGLNPEQCLGKFPHQLSGGQLQRLLIARALLLDVQLLVADEIISMIDASTRIDVLNLLADLKARGLSILFVTHDLSLAHYISERAVILYRGVIVEMGATELIFNNPQHPYTRTLMASVPRLDKKWEEKEAELAARKIQLANGYVFYEHDPGAGKDLHAPAHTLVEIERGHFVACMSATQG